MELKAGPGGEGWELWAGPGSSEQADNSLGRSWFLSRQGRPEIGSQGAGLGAEGGLRRRQTIVGRGLGRGLVAWGRGQASGWAV